MTTACPKAVADGIERRFYIVEISQVELEDLTTY